MRSSKREALLQAAGRVVQRDGASRLTLDAVAAEAGLSKGGLLYHFPNKEALLVALVEALVSRFDGVLATYEARERGPGAFARAYLRAYADPRSLSGDALSAALLGVVSSDPALLAPLRNAYRVWQRRLDDAGLAPEIAAVVRASVDGLWAADLFGLAPLEAARRASLLAWLLSLVSPTEAS
jgi:AcrR family transcriptional regulator